MKEEQPVDVLGAVWRRESPEVRVDLERLVRRQSLRMRVNAAVELLISIVFLGGSLWLAIAQATVEFLVLAVGVWMITLAALTSSFTMRAGTWAAATHDTREFLTLSLRRCRAGLAAIRFGFYLLAVEVVLLAAWHAWYWSSRTSAPSPGVWLLAACLPAVFLVALLVLRAQRRRELARLETLERELIG